MLTSLVWFVYLQDSRIRLKTEDIRSGLADVLDTLQWVDGVRAAKNAGSEHDGEGVG